jgi:hypothetical protein
MRLLKFITYPLRRLGYYIHHRLGYYLYLLFIIPYIFYKSKKAGKDRKYHQMPRLLWGPVPILNNKYWCNALKESGYVSHTLMTGHYPINKKEDFDYYLGDYIKSSDFFKKYFNRFVRFFEFIEIINSYDIIHIPCTGFILSDTFLKGYELKLLKLAGVKIVVIPYGGDYFRYSRIKNPLLINGFLKSYPDAARVEKEIQDNVDKWVRNADIFLPGIALDGIGRWDIVVPSNLVMDLQKWTPTVKETHFDGSNGVVRVLHTPNHRGFKGTEFIINACNELKAEGLKIELLLVEGMSNDEVAKLMKYEVDILVEQLIFTGYALSGLEGMASGLPVLCNFDDPHYTHLFYLYSYLNECPALSTTPFTIKENLRLLITKPELRRELGKAGPKYVRKYHSYSTAQFLFGEIYKKIWFNEDVNLMELFEPIKENSYNNMSEKIEHPLVRGKIVHS